MDDKQKVFWNLDILVKMCRSKSDGPALRVEESELFEKISSIDAEIEEIKTQSEEDEYDTSAEMADRNIEIITKRQLQTLRSNLKDKNKLLDTAKEEENKFYSQEKLLQEDKKSCEDYVFSMQERINESTDQETNNHYTTLISETKEKIDALKDKIQSQSQSHSDIQSTILQLTEEIKNIEEEIARKKKLLVETQASLENKDNYIDKTKKEKTAKKIEDLLNKKEKLQKRLDEIRQDPQYIVTKIKDIINEKQEIEKSQDYFAQLVNIAIHEPYMNVPTNNILEEELLRATQIRDSFANEMDQKNYNILEADTPEKVRTEYLKQRISEWEQQLEEIKNNILSIDRDTKYQFRAKEQTISDMIKTMESDLVEYQKAYEDIPDSKIGTKATYKVAYDEKKDDLIAAKHILQDFRKDESDEIEKATYLMRTECTNIANKIAAAFAEMEEVKNRLLSKKSGAIDIASQNKDKEILKELAQTVIDIKHRRQFSETPIDIVHRLEEILKINITNLIDTEYIQKTNHLVSKDYSLALDADEQILDESFNEPIETLTEEKPTRGIKVLEESQIENAEEFLNPLNQSDQNTNNQEPSLETVESSEENLENSKENAQVQENNNQTLETGEGTQVNHDQEIPADAPLNPSDETTLEPPVEDEETSSDSASSQDSTDSSPSLNLEETNSLDKDSDNDESLSSSDIQPILSEPEDDTSTEQVDNKIEENKSNLDAGDELSINAIFNSKNNEKKSSKSVNIVSSENLANELDEYINNLKDNNN